MFQQLGPPTWMMPYVKTEATMICDCLQVKVSVVTPVFHRSHLRVMVLDLATPCRKPSAFSI